MQPMGQLLAFIVGLIVLVAYGRSRKLAEQKTHDGAASITDSMWRIIVGFGGVPLLFGVFFRPSVPESLRCTLGVLRESGFNPRLLQVSKDVQRHYAEDLPSYVEEPDLDEINDEIEMSALEHVDISMHETVPVRASSNMDLRNEGNVSSRRHKTLLWAHSSQNSIQDADSTRFRDNRTEFPSHLEREGLVNEKDPFSAGEIKQFFWYQGHWHWLAGTSLCSLFLHAAFSVLGNYDYRVLAQIWTSTTPSQTFALPTSFSDVQSEIYKMFSDTTTRSLIMVSSGAILGSVLAINLIEYVRRRLILLWSSLVFAALFLFSGIVILRASSAYRILNITLYILMQLIFRIGKSVAPVLKSTFIDNTHRSQHHHFYGMSYCFQALVA